MCTQWRIICTQLSKNMNWKFLRVRFFLFTFFSLLLCTSSFLPFVSTVAGNTRIQSDYTSRCLDRKYFTLICKKLIMIEYQYKTKAAMHLQRWWRNTYYTTIFVHTVEMEYQRHTNAAKAIQAFFRAKNLMFLLKLWVVHFGNVEPFLTTTNFQPTSVLFSLGTCFERKVRATTSKHGGGCWCLATKNEACWNWKEPRLRNMPCLLLKRKNVFWPPWNPDVRRKQIEWTTTTTNNF